MSSVMQRLAYLTALTYVGLLLRRLRMRASLSHQHYLQIR